MLGRGQDEAPENQFKETVRLKSYPVEELGGLIWGYLGPGAAPLLPRWDLFVVDNVFRQQATLLPCNWLQCQENAVDAIHTDRELRSPTMLERLGSTDERHDRALQPGRPPPVKRRLRAGARGIQKYRAGGRDRRTPRADAWATRWCFPTTSTSARLRRVPIRAPRTITHTWHLGIVYFPGTGGRGS